MELNFFCKWLGHSWMYRSAEKQMRGDGEKYGYSETRKCKRCSLMEYKYQDWVSAEKRDTNDLY